MLLAVVLLFVFLGIFLILSLKRSVSLRKGPPFSKCWIGALALSILVSGLLFTLYVCVQQSYRSGAQDPQHALALEMVARLNHRDSVTDLMPHPKIDLSASELPFAMLIDASGKTLESTATLNGAVPEIPLGSLRCATTYGRNSITWQPASGIRFALAILPVKMPPCRYVAVGRSLREVDRRERQLFFLVLIAWLAAQIWILCATLWLDRDR